MPQDVIRLDLPFMISVLQARCQTFSPWKECLPNQFHVNGLGGNHSPLVRLRVQLLKHAPREKYRKDGGQEEANKKVETLSWGRACSIRGQISSGRSALLKWGQRHRV